MQNLNRNNLLAATGAFTLFLATALGAYGTHALQGKLNPESWNAFQIAVDYQFYHGLGVIAAAILAARFPQSRWIGASGWILLGGMITFCGSIYATTFGAPGGIGSLAPLGGLGMMSGWLGLAVGALRAR